MHGKMFGSLLRALAFLCTTSRSQPNRIGFNNQQLFLSGGNLAWMSFGNDIGPGPLDSSTFGDILLQIHNAGGNAVRWWLHTDGVNTPEVNDTGLVIGPGPTTVANLRRALDIAWQREIGLNLCLWSFDMLRSTNPSAVLNRNLKLLSDTAYIRAYIDKCLIPMVDSLKDKKGILAWEIFNEPEGMSDYWYFHASDPHVSMATIQRFVNLCAGAIHRADPNAKVTNGAWSFQSLTDLATFPASIRKGIAKVNATQQETMRIEFNFKNRTSLTPDEFNNYLQRVASGPTANYYSDNRLIAAGGDTLGTLDFYEVHYYSWGKTSLSPFQNAASTWGLDKPIVVAEFGITDFTGLYPNFTPKQTLYNILYQNGYAGALAWAWTDIGFTTHGDMLAAIQYVWNNHRSDVDVLGGGSDWPTVSIISPEDGSQFPDSTHMLIRATVMDTLAVDSMTFFVADTERIGSVITPDSTAADTSYYTFAWQNILAGNYTLKAVAFNASDHQGVSNPVQLSFGKPPMTRVEAEAAMRTGPGMSVANDPTASKGAYISLSTGSNDTSAKITWQFTNVSSPGPYPITIGYRVPFGTKTQFINVNGVQVAALEFGGNSTTAWYEKNTVVGLLQGINTVQMQMSWGWMYIDYLALPTVVLTSVGTPSRVPSTFALIQNYPNPFNPTTTISYTIPKSAHVKLAVFDVLGREIVRLADKTQQAGDYSVPFDAVNLSSGVYFCRIEASSFVQTKKLLLLK